jgi:hypothetical protein
MFRRLKEFRRTGTRYEKLDVMFSAFIYLALSVFLAVWLVPRCVNTPPRAKVRQNRVFKRKLFNN